MKDPRNPFRMRASEHIASDTTFLRLFGPGVLEQIPAEEPFSRVFIIRSAPGGGKTSLLRAFTPSSILSLIANRTHDEYKDLYAKMKDLGAVNDKGPQLLGIMLSCRKNYATLDDLPWEPRHRERLFFSLLNCRVLLSTMRAALQLRSLKYPDDLTKLTLKGDIDICRGLGLPNSGRGDEVFEWAINIEAEISKVLDSLDPQPPDAIGHSDLSSLQLLRPTQVLIDDSPVASRLLVMLDDVHRLSPSQRLCLGKALDEVRDGAATWLAERLDALRADELLEIGAKRDRDYSENATTLETYWRVHPKRFQRTLSAIADKRVREAQQIEIDSFITCVPDTLETPDMTKSLEEMFATTRERINSNWRHEERFQHWLASAEATEGTAYERGAAWQVLDILIARENRKRQLSFDLLPLSPEEKERRDDSSVKAAAELFLAERFRLPYYFGFPKLASLASSNIELFLAIAGELFEEASSAAILGRPYQLSVERQHAIVKRAARQWWDRDVLRGLPLQAEVRRLVEAIGRFGQRETYQANAPYAPGVTGIAITMAEREQLRNENYLKSRPDLSKLSRVLGICLAQNLLEAILDHSQGNARRMVLYLNRFLCCYFDLPLQYGGWRAKKPQELALWTLRDFGDHNRNEGRLL